MKFTTVGMAMIDDKAHAFVTRYNKGDTFDFELVDTTLQALVETLDKIYPDWYDAKQRIAKGMGV